jgi:aryl sulfotransferase
MICALLVHQSRDLPGPMAAISPWLDMNLESIEDIVTRLDAQTYQRVIKTHTPLDGLPWDENCHYVFCGREPKDVFMSLQNHLENARLDRVAELLRAQGIDFVPPPELPEDIDERFAIWMTMGAFDWEQDGIPFWSHFNHARTFWEHREQPNIHFLHYADLKQDLEGEMRGLSEALGLEVPETHWIDLVQAATFDDMKKHADQTAPDTDHQIWQSNSKFFNKGTNEQWRGVLSDESIALYNQLSRERYDPDLLAWLENGSLETKRP